MAKRSFGRMRTCWKCKNEYYQEKWNPEWKFRAPRCPYCNTINKDWGDRLLDIVLALGGIRIVESDGQGKLPPWFFSKVLRATSRPNRDYEL
eukprot:g57090.t1